MVIIPTSPTGSMFRHIIKRLITSVPPVQDGENTTQTTVRMLQAKPHRHRKQSLAQRTVWPPKRRSRIPWDTERCSQPQKRKCMVQNTARR